MDLKPFPLTYVVCDWVGGKGQGENLISLIKDLINLALAAHKSFRSCLHFLELDCQFLVPRT